MQGLKRTVNVHRRGHTIKFSEAFRGGIYLYTNETLTAPIMVHGWETIKGIKLYFKETLSFIVKTETQLIL